MRMSQEIVLGIGGIKALNKLEIKPTGWHMNEGHSGFFQLERAKDIMKETGLSFEEAKVLCLVKDKSLQSKYKVTYEIVREAYPDIQWGGRS